jgi:hypothetical protein
MSIGPTIAWERPSSKAMGAVATPAGCKGFDRESQVTGRKK